MSSRGPTKVGKWWTRANRNCCSHPLHSLYVGLSIHCCCCCGSSSARLFSSTCSNSNYRIHHESSITSSSSCNADWRRVRSPIGTGQHILAPSLFMRSLVACFSLSQIDYNWIAVQPEPPSIGEWYSNHNFLGARLLRILLLLIFPCPCDHLMDRFERAVIVLWRLCLCLLSVVGNLSFPYSILIQMQRHRLRSVVVKLYILLRNWPTTDLAHNIHPA